MVLGTKELDESNYKEKLTSREIDYIKSCLLYYKINIEYNNTNNRTIILFHYLIKDEHSNYPFEENSLKNDIQFYNYEISKAKSKLNTKEKEMTKSNGKTYMKR